MDRSTGKNDEGTIAQWEAFFRACGIPHERSQSHAAKFAYEFVRPHELSTYTKDDYEKLGIRFGDRKVIEKYLRNTDGNPPQFAECKPVVRPSDDDIIWEPAPKVAAPPRGPQRKPEISGPQGLSTASTGRSSLSRSATSPPTSTKSIANASSTSCTDSGKIAASSITCLPRDCQQVLGAPSSAQVVGSQTFGELGTTECVDDFKQEPIEQTSDVGSNRLSQEAAIKDNWDFAGPTKVATSEVQNNVVEADLSTAATHNTQAVLGSLESSLAVTLSMAIGSVSAGQSPGVLDATVPEHSLEHQGDETENHQPPRSDGSTSKLQNSSHVEHIQHEPLHERSTTTSAKTGKIRLTRPTPAAPKAPSQIEMIHEDVFPPPDLRNACHQMSIDQLRRNGQLVEHNHEATLEEQHRYFRRSLSACTKSVRFSSQSSAHQSSSLRRTPVNLTGDEKENGENLVFEAATADKDNACDGEIGHEDLQMEWEAMESIVIDTTEDEPTGAIPANTALTNPEVEQSSIAMHVSHQDSSELPTKPRSSRAVKNKETGNGQMDFDDDVESAGSARTVSDVGLGNAESPDQRRIGKRNPRRSAHDSRSRSTAKQAGQKTKHGAVNRHTCDECRKEFPSQIHLLKHMQVHTGERPYACDECPRRFKRRDDLKRHKQIHSGERPAECPECGQRFYRKYHLKVHKRLHTGEKPYECEKCQKRFNNTGSYSMHMLGHSGEKPHVCEVCRKAFARSGHLVDHMRTHTGEKPYECEECSMCFTTSSALTTHKRRHRSGA